MRWIAAEARFSGKVIVQNSDFRNKLHLLSAASSVESYGNSADWRWLRNISDDIFQGGKIMVTIIHLGCWTRDKTKEGITYWIPLIINGASGEILYGDSLALDQLMPSTLEQAVQT